MRIGLIDEKSRFSGNGSNHAYITHQIVTENVSHNVQKNGLQKDKHHVKDVIYTFDFFSLLRILN